MDTNKIFSRCFFPVHPPFIFSLHSDIDSFSRRECRLFFRCGNPYQNFACLSDESLEAEILLEARLVRVEKFIVNFRFPRKTIFSRPIGAAVGRLSLSADAWLRPIFRVGGFSGFNMIPRRRLTNGGTLSKRINFLAASSRALYSLDASAQCRQSGVRVDEKLGLQAAVVNTTRVFIDPTIRFRKTTSYERDFEWVAFPRYLETRNFTFGWNSGWIYEFGFN